MTAAAAGRVSFKEASTLLDELAGLALDPKQVEGNAEALGRVIAADERRAVERLFRRLLSPSRIRGYTLGCWPFGALWPGTASGQRLHPLLSGSRSA